MQGIREVRSCKGSTITPISPDLGGGAITPLPAGIPIYSPDADYNLRHLYLEAGRSLLRTSTSRLARYSYF